MKKVAIITGASSLIGQAIIQEMACDYTAFILHYHSDRSKELLEDFMKDYPQCEYILFQGDLAIEDNCKQLVAMAKETYGRIDALVNNAGIVKDKLVLMMKEEDFDVVMKTNLYATFNLTKHALSLMTKQREGRIITIGSVIGIIGNAGQANYAASKAAIIGFSKSVAKEYASRNITCNVVAPGFITTAMTDKLSDTVKENILKTIPLQRFGQPSDVANIVGFLASPKANYITGQVLQCDGGMVM